MLQRFSLVFLAMGVLSFTSSLPAQEKKAVPAEVGPPVLRHKGAINSLAFSLDGKVLASAGDDQTVRLWDVATGKELHQWHGHKGRVFSVAISPDGKMVASSGEDHLVFLWEIGTGKILKCFKAHNGTAYGLTFSPDKGYLATSADTITLWEVPAARKVRRFQKETQGTIGSLSFSRGGERLASGADCGTVLMWSLLADELGVLRPKIIQWYRGHSGGVEYVAISPNLKYLASGGSEALFLWDAEEGTKVHEWKLRVYSNIVFSRDSKMLIASLKNETRFWDVATKKEIRSLPWETTAANALALHPNGKFLATGCWQGAIRLWDVGTGKQVRPGKLSER